MILDTGCTKAMCSRHAYLLMRQGLSEGQVQLLPDSEPPLFTDFSIFDEVKVPFLMSLPQTKNLGVSLDLEHLRGYCFIQGF